jgi:hypothetical protein
MKTLRWVLGVLSLSCWNIAAAAPFEAPIVPTDPAAAGRELVARLLALRPAEATTNEAVLRVRVNKTNQFEVPVRIEVSISETNWSTTYSTRYANAGETNGNSLEIESAIINRTAAQTNLYEQTLAYFQAERGRAIKGVVGISIGPQVRKSAAFGGADAFVPFAGSDFWLADFGMEFLHWPTQRLLKKELCRGQSCDKLESLAQAGETNGYVRVVSWFDIDTGGPVLVEAYDAKGRFVKEFKPNDFKKVDGQWQVEELEMNNLRTGSRSYLRFKLDAK